MTSLCNIIYIVNENELNNIYCYTHVAKKQKKGR